MKHGTTLTAAATILILLLGLAPVMAQERLQEEARAILEGIESKAVVRGESPREASVAEALRLIEESIIRFENLAKGESDLASAAAADLEKARATLSGFLEEYRSKRSEEAALEVASEGIVAGNPEKPGEGEILVESIPVLTAVAPDQIEQSVEREAGEASAERAVVKPPEEVGTTEDAEEASVILRAEETADVSGSLDKPLAARLMAILSTMKRLLEDATSLVTNAISAKTPREYLDAPPPWHFKPCGGAYDKGR